MTEVIKVPEHLGIIPDGNRRWAKKRHRPAIEGHRQGYKRLRELSALAMDMGISWVSTYGFSEENFGRSEQEVREFRGMLKHIAKRDVKSIDRDNIRLRFIGRREKFDAETVALLQSAEELTEGNTHGNLVVCLGYNGQDEIVDAARAINEADYESEEIDRTTITKHMYIPEMPDMDLLIRTSGEQRTSGFMPYQASYAELMFPEKLWPDFTAADLTACIDDFSDRQRRFGQ